MGKWTEEARANLSKKLKEAWARKKRVTRGAHTAKVECTNAGLSSKLDTVINKLNSIAKQLS